MSVHTIGLIGAGEVIDRHVEALQVVKGLSVVAVCDVQKDRAERIAAQFPDSRAYTEYRDVFDLCPDVVVLCLPHNLHCRIACEGLNAGCNVVVEKPMAVSPAECRRMLETAAALGKLLYVAESSTYSPGPILTGNKYAKGLLGRFFTGCVVDNRSYDLVNRPAWGLSVKGSGGGLFANVGSHRLAIARACLPGLEPRTVSGWISHMPGHEIEACASGIVKYSGGGAMHYENTGYFGKAPFGNTIHFVFETGIVAWDDRKWMIYNEHTGGLHEEELEPDDAPYIGFYRRLCRILEGDNEYRPKAWEYAVDIAIAHALYTSSKAGTAINLFEPPWDLTDLQYL